MPRLAGMLRRRGATPHEIDDILQEAAVRVLEAGPTYDSADDLWRWAATVTGRLWIDLLRRRRDSDPVEQVVVAAATDVAHEVESRMALAAAMVAIQELRSPDRDEIRRAVAAARASETTVLDDQRRRVALHRARHRLRLRLEGLIAVLATAWWRARTRAAGREPSTLMTAGAAALAMSVLVLPVPPDRPDPSPIARGPGHQLDSTAPVPAAAPAAPTLQAPPARSAAMPPAPGTAGPRQTTAATAAAAATGTSADISYPTPLGTGRVGTRPRGAREPVLCAEVDHVGRHCIEPPTPAVPLPPAAQVPLSP